MRNFKFEFPVGKHFKLSLCLHEGGQVSPMVVGLFDSTVLVGGAKKPPYLTLDW